MPPNPNLVFVSHTSKMAAHAQRAIDAVLHACHLPRDMQFFNASSDTPANVCIRAVRECCVYIGIFGPDYGSPVRDQPDVSYTQLEFRTAIAQRKLGLRMEIFVFVLEGQPSEPKQQRFLQEVLDAGITVKKFRTADELSGFVAATLAKELPPVRADRPQQHAKYLTQTFTGRADEIDQILAEINAGSSQIGFVSALKGTGGVGKTTLAAEVARRLNHPLRLPAGILWANLHDELPANIARRWLRDLGEPILPSPSGRGAGGEGDLSEDALLARFHEVAANRPGLLIVLDNAQPPTMGVRDADKLLVKAPGVVTLITTRFQEALPRGVQPRNIEELTPADAEALLRRLIGVEFDRHPYAAREVIQHSGRLPLLLNPTYDVVINEGVPLPEYAKELRANALRRIGRHDPQVASVFDISWKHLKSLQRELFAVLAWAPGETIGVNLARVWLRLYHPKALAETPYLAEQTLKKLDNASLLIPASDRYRYHDRARDYARLQVEKMESKVKEGLLRCWCDWDFVKSEFDAIGAYGLADQYRMLHAWGVTEPASFLPWYHFVRRDATLFAANPEAFVAMVACEAKNSPVAQAALPILQREGVCWVEWRNRTENFMQPPCLQVFWGHTGGVTAVSVTADGRRAVSGSKDTTVRVWDLERGVPGPVFRGHTSEVNAVSLTADGCRVVAGSKDNTVRVWDQERGTPGPVLQGHREGVTAVSVTADGRRAVSGSYERTVRVWDLEYATPGPVLQGHILSVLAVSVTADGRRAVSGSLDNTVRVWDLERGTPGPVLRGHTDWVTAVSLTESGHRAVSGSWDNTVRVWDLERGTPGPVLQGHTSAVHAVSVTADGRRAVSGSFDKTVRVWDLERGVAGPVLLGHTDEVKAVSVTADGRRAVSGSNDNSVRVWDLERSTPGLGLLEPTKWVHSVSVTADGRCAVSGSYENTVRVWDLERGVPGPVLEGHTAWVSAVSVTADGCRAVSGSDDKTVRVWDLDRGVAGPVLQGHTHPATAVSVTADGRRAVSGSSDNTVRVWDLGTGAAGPVLRGHTNSVRAVSVTADGRRAVSGSVDKTVRVWDLERGQCLATHPEDTREARQAWYVTEPQRRVWLFREGHFLVYRSAPGDEILARFPGTFPKFACGLDGVNALAFDDAHQPYFLRLHRGNA